MIRRLKRVLLIAAIAFFCLAGLLILVVALMPQVVIGEGQLENWVRGVETFDFKWWIVGGAVALWLFPAFAAIVFLMARRSGLEITHLRTMLRRAFANQTVPLQVDVDQRIPIDFDEDVAVPIRVRTTIDIDDTIELGIDVPFRTELPIDTEVETSVLGFGKLRVPIRTRLPIDVMIPIRGRTHLRAIGIPVDINAVAVARLPRIHIPLHSRIEAKIDLLSNFHAAGGFLADSGVGVWANIKSFIRQATRGSESDARTDDEHGDGR